MKKVILCGFNWSGCEALDILLKKKYHIFVYTHLAKYFEPDIIRICKKKKISFTTSKIALNNIPFKPDLIISISYKYKIPHDVLSLSKFKPFNLHPSLLPKYRGCSSIPWAMVNGEKMCGFTYHYMNEKYDDGNIILQKSIEIKKFDLQSTLYYRVMFDSLIYFNQALKKVLNNYPGKKQKGKSTYFKRGAPYEGVLKKKWKGTKRENFIKAMIFPPLPLARFNKKYIKKY
tara:strand:- start:242 stop:934 length:693 start_codon:yes stop_codon:yes gene_type:complete